jgi:hypothetical protein
MTESRAEGIQRRAKQAQAAANSLNSFIVDKQTADHLLRLAMNHLSDVETFLLPNAQKAETEGNADLWYHAAENMLHMSEEQLRRVKDLTNKYGRDIRIVGGDSGGARFVPKRGIMR